MVKPTPITKDDIDAAAKAIKAGQLVAFGTETVYGLGGNACDDHAVARIFAAKGRPSFNPLISHVPDVDTAFQYGLETPLARKLADQFWPGPMTLIMAKPDQSSVSDLATAGLDSIAIRVPAKPHARAFLASCGCPVAAPSANRSGRISPTLASHVAEELGQADELAFILEFGAAEDGLESTVIDARGDQAIILRPGSITQDMLAEITSVVTMGKDSGIISPGQLESHYAPEKPVILNVTSPEDADIHIGFGDSDSHLSLSPKGDLTEAAANLYHCLREADKHDGKRISIAPIPHQGLGVAINDRLTRAAAAR